jgi:hypothetical protein
MTGQSWAPLSSSPALAFCAPPDSTFSLLECFDSLPLFGVECCANIALQTIFTNLPHNQHERSSFDRKRS